MDPHSLVGVEPIFYIKCHRTVFPEQFSLETFFGDPAVMNGIWQCFGSGFRGLLDPDSESGSGSRDLKKCHQC